MNTLIIIWKWRDFEELTQKNPRKAEYPVEGSGDTVVLISETDNINLIKTQIEAQLEKDRSIIVLFHEREIYKDQLSFVGGRIVNLSGFKEKGMPYCTRKTGHDYGLIDTVGYFKSFAVNDRDNINYKVLQNGKIKKVNFESVWNYFSGLEISKNLDKVLNNLLSVRLATQATNFFRGENDSLGDYLDLVSIDFQDIIAANNDIIKELASKYQVEDNTLFSRFIQNLVEIHELMQRSGSDGLRFSANYQTIFDNHYESLESTISKLSIKTIDQDASE